MLRRMAWSAVAVALGALALSPLTARAVESLTFRPAGNITMRSLSGVIFSSEIGRVQCNTTLSGTFTSSSIEAAEGAYLGAVSRSEVSGCTGGTLTLLAEASAPWRFYVETTQGTLPNMTSITFWVPITILERIEGIGSCLYKGRISARLATTLVEGSRERLTTGLFTLLESGQSYSAITTLSGFCPTTARVTGSLSLTAQEVILQQNPPDQFTAENNAILFTGTGTHQYRFRNTGALITLGPSRLLHEIAGLPSAGFTIIGDGCNNAVVANGGICTVEVRFTAPGDETKVDRLFIEQGGQPKGRTVLRAA
jgi:hypothetical protein